MDNVTWLLINGCLLVLMIWHSIKLCQRNPHLARAIILTPVMIKAVTVILCTVIVNSFFSRYVGNAALRVGFYASIVLWCFGSVIIVPLWFLVLRFLTYNHVTAQPAAMPAPVAPPAPVSSPKPNQSRLPQNPANPFLRQPDP